jgi:2-Cys peroxiredoxin 5
MVQVGDSIPSIVLKEGKPDVEVDLSKELGSGIIIGVPAAFSTLFHCSTLAARDLILLPGPTCTDSHIPGYIAHPKLKDAGKVFVVSVNDAFVYVSPVLNTHPI